MDFLFGRKACQPFDFKLPVGILPPPVYTDNCLDAAKVALGRKLFYDTRLSLNEKQSCASCHKQSLAFTDGKGRAVGSTGMVHARNTPSLSNVGYFKELTWADPKLKRLENQAINPLFSADGPVSIVELGIGRMEHVLIRRLEEEGTYGGLFLEAFGNRAITVPALARALEAFQMNILSFQSSYDRGHMESAAMRGLSLFREKGCIQCHSGINFNEPSSGETFADFRNIGLYNIGGTGDYPDYALHGPAALKRIQGLQAVTGRASDRGRFRIPSLRNVALTAPYMHDGSVASLAEVIEIFNQGGRNVVYGPFAGDGRNSPVKDPLMQPLHLTDGEKVDLLAFLNALSDDCLVSNPNLSDPNQAPPVLPAHCR